MPSDATLSQTVTHRSTRSSGSTTIGYSFIWRHSNPAFGGDKIVVTVDNVAVKTCSAYSTFYDSLGRPHQYCSAYQTTYPMRTSYFYRLWRSFGQQQYLLSSSGSPQAPPQSSSASVYSSVQNNPTVKGELDSFGTLVGYCQGYFTPDIATIDNTAYPAYHFFFSSGAVITADALNGNVYQVTQ